MIDRSRLREDTLVIKDLMPNIVGVQSYQINALIRIIDLAEKYLNGEIVDKQPSRGISKDDIYRMFDEIGLPRGKEQLLLTSHHLEDLAEAILKRLEGV